MSERIDNVVRRGQAYRDDQLVAVEVELTERFRHRQIEVPLPGTGGYGYKPETVRLGPDLVVFHQVEQELRDELEKLVAASRDPDLRRRHRDRLWAPKPITLVLEYEATLHGCVVRPPSESWERVEAIPFPIDLPAAASRSQSVERL